MPVQVEVIVSVGMPSFAIVGKLAAAIAEGSVETRAAHFCIREAGSTPLFASDASLKEGAAFPHSGSRLHVAVRLEALLKEGEAPFLHSKSE